MTPSALIDDLIRREGTEYTNWPADHGGPTKFGVTQKTLTDFRGYPVKPEDVQNLTEQEARQIYMNLYYLGPGFNRINDDALAAFAVDSGVQHGQSRVVKWLQKIVGVKVDGKLGPVTASAINFIRPRQTYKGLFKRRLKFYAEIIHKDHSQAVFVQGWMNRMCEFVDAM